MPCAAACWSDCEVGRQWFAERPSVVFSFSFLGPVWALAVWQQRVLPVGTEQLALGPQHAFELLLPFQRFAVSRITYWSRDSWVALLCDW